MKFLVHTDINRRLVWIDRIEQNSAAHHFPRELPMPLLHLIHHPALLRLENLVTAWHPIDFSIDRIELCSKGASLLLSALTIKHCDELILRTLPRDVRGKSGECLLSIEFVYYGIPYFFIGAMLRFPG